MANTYLRRRTKYTPRENNGFWLTFSDLMTSLVLIFVLVLFYSCYQYFDMLEIKTAELMRQSGLLDQRQSELDEKNVELTQKTQENEAAQQKLTESEKELIAQQAKLLLAQQAQEETDKTLAERQKDLDNALSLLDMQQQDLTAAKALLSQQQAMMSEQQTKLDDLVGVRVRIVQSLAQALASANVKADVDRQTGSITLNANVLFDVGRSELKEGGEVVLDQFLPVYLSVLLSPENQSNISEIIIEGHTDSQGTYMDNLRLSQERALSVMQYVLSDGNTHLSPGQKTKLRQIGTANGRSFSNLIIDHQGIEDADASRRVEFKFRMQDEQMIQSMREILDSMDAAR